MRYVQIVLIASLSFLFLHQDANGQKAGIETNDELHILFKEIGDYEKSLNTWGRIFRGKHPERIGSTSEEDFKTQLKNYNDFLNRLVQFQNVELSEKDRISQETMHLKLSGEIGQLEHQSYLIPFNAEGGFFNTIASALGRLPFSNLEDFTAYQKWLPSYVEYLDVHKALLQSGVEQGIVAPKVIVNNLKKQIEPWVKRTIDHPMVIMLKNKPEEVNTEEWDIVKKEIFAIMETEIWPAYGGLSEFINNEYFNAAYETPGISNIPNGKSYYEDRVAFYTTIDITPEEVFQTGLEEVARIRASMEAIIEELNFKGSFEDFLVFLRTDDQFYASTPQELLSYASWLSKKAEGQLPKLFSHLYRLPFTVEPVPADIAPTYTSGRYVQGNRNQDRPGIYWVNTYNLPARSLYNLPALTVHEAVPGHHLQIMLAAELENIPSFRNSFYISAFGEGWGLYSEYLGEEMGMYETPYDRFGRYTYEMWRACRLVVDVGLHYKNWNRQQAVDFLAGNTALSLHEVNTEIDRYIGWPGQALSYKMGEITIKNLRQKATAELGTLFDIKEFHYHVLKNGSIPLPTLIREINTWIDSKNEK